MTTIAIHHPRFEIVEYIKKLRNAGVTQEVAEVQAQELEHVMESILEQTKEVIENKELATKGDIGTIKTETQLIKGEIRETELRLQKEMKGLEIQMKKLEIKLMSLYGAGFLILFGMLAKGFHWL